MIGKKNLIALLFILFANVAFCQLKAKLRLYADPFNALQNYTVEVKAGGFLQLEQFIDLNKSITFGVGLTAMQLDHRDVYNNNLFPTFSAHNLALISDQSRFTLVTSYITFPLEFNFYVRKTFNLMAGVHFNLPYRFAIIGWDEKPDIYFGDQKNSTYVQNNINTKNLKPYTYLVFGFGTTVFRRLDIGAQFDWNTMSMFQDYELTDTATWGKESSDYFFVSLSLRLMLFRLKI